MVKSTSEHVILPLRRTAEDQSSSLAIDLSSDVARIVLVVGFHPGVDVAMDGHGERMQVLLGHQSDGKNAEATVVFGISMQER